jgi:hypothetical protein
MPEINQLLINRAHLSFPRRMTEMAWNGTTEPQTPSYTRSRRPIFGWLTKHRGSRLTDAAAAVTADIDAYIERCVRPAGDQFLSVFVDWIMRVVYKEGAARAYARPDVDPHEIVRIKWKAFEENLHEFAREAHAEINRQVVFKWGETLNDFEGLRTSLTDYISKRVAGIISEMRLKASSMLPPTLASELEQVSGIER